MIRSIRHLAWAAIPAAAAMLTPFAANAETAQEAANKQVVIDYFAALDRMDSLPPDQARKELPVALAKYCRPDYIQHNESMAAFGQGTAGLIAMFESIRANPSQSAPGASRVITVMAQGDLVVRINTRERPDGGKPVMIFNLFRMQNGLIAEHWDGYSGSFPQ